MRREHAAALRRELCAGAYVPRRNVAACRSTSALARMTCPVCFSYAYSGVSLSSGDIVHVNCLQKVTGAIADADRTLSSERARIVALRQQLALHETYIGKVARFFGRGVDLEDLRLRIESAETSIHAAELACESARAKATPVFDLMLDYPPDWSLRSAAVAERDRVCTNCGSSRTLQAHHVVPLSKGGTNKLTNLKLLCERCHKRAHGGKEFTTSNSAAPLAIADRVQLLKIAIAGGDDVEFMYRKPTDASHKKRRVTPRALIEIDHKQGDGRTLCLNGYCHLRRAERNFALKRMKGLKLAKE